MQVGLSAKTAIVTGSTGGTGFAIIRGRAKRAAGSGVTLNPVLPGPALSEGVERTLKEAAASSQSVEQAALAFVEANRPSSII